MVWALIVAGLLLAVISMRGERSRSRYYSAHFAALGRQTRFPRATVIVPVKGPEDGLEQNLAALASLDYPDYELIVVANLVEDIPRGVVPEHARVVLARGRGGGGSEKIRNLLAAVKAARPTSAIFAFADSDGRPGRLWLRSLAEVLQDDRAGAATGYRWHVPERGGLWAILRSVWNAVIAGRFGPGPLRFAWGGAMAIRREVFVRTSVADFWKDAVSDDYRLSDAVLKAGLQIRFAPGAIVADTGGTGCREFCEWTRRQMLLTRFHRPALWWMALISHLVYCGAAAACLIELARGQLAAAWALVILWGLGMWKAARRAALARSVLNGYEGWFRRYGWVYTWLPPLMTWVWLGSLLSSAFGRIIHWRERSYRLTQRRAARA